MTLPRNQTPRVSSAFKPQTRAPGTVLQGAPGFWRGVPAKDSVCPLYARSYLSTDVCRAIDELQSRAIRIAEVGARPIDRAAAPVLLEEHVDALRAQAVHRRLIFRRVDHESVVHAVRHIERAFNDRRRALDQQHAHPAGIEEGDGLVGPLRQKFTADDFGIEFRAPVDVANRDAEMRDAFNVRHGPALFRCSQDETLSLPRFHERGVVYS